MSGRDESPRLLIEFLQKENVTETSSIPLPTSSSGGGLSIFTNREEFREEFSNLFHESINYYVNNAYKYGDKDNVKSDDTVDILNFTKNLGFIKEEYYPIHLLSCITFLDGPLNKPLFNKMITKNLSILYDEKYKTKILWHIEMIIDNFGKDLLITKPRYDESSDFKDIYKEFHEIVQIYRMYLNPNNFITNYNDEDANILDKEINEEINKGPDLDSFNDVYNFKKIDPKLMNITSVSLLEQRLLRKDEDPLNNILLDDESINESTDEMKDFYNNTMSNITTLVDIT